MLKKIRVATSKKPAASSNYFRRTSVGGAMDAVPLYVSNVQSASFADAGQRAYQMATGASVGAGGYHMAKQAQTAHYDAAAQRAYQLASGASVSGTMAEAKKAMSLLQAQQAVEATQTAQFDQAARQAYAMASGASLGAMRMNFPQVGGQCGSVGAMLSGLRGLGQASRSRNVQRTVQLPPGQRSYLFNTQDPTSSSVAVASRNIAFRMASPDSYIRGSMLLVRSTDGGVRVASVASSNMGSLSSDSFAAGSSVLVEQYLLGPGEYPLLLLVYTDGSAPVVSMMAGSAG